MHRKHHLSSRLRFRTFHCKKYMLDQKEKAQKLSICVKIFECINWNMRSSYTYFRIVLLGSQLLVILIDFSLFQRNGKLVILIYCNESLKRHI